MIVRRGLMRPTALTVSTTTQTRWMLRIRAVPNTLTESCSVTYITVYLHHGVWTGITVVDHVCVFVYTTLNLPCCTCSAHETKEHHVGSRVTPLAACSRNVET